MTSDHLYDDVKHLYTFKYFVSNFKAISNANEQLILCLIIIRMTSDHSHDDHHSNDESLDHSHDE